MILIVDSVSFVYEGDLSFLIPICQIRMAMLIDVGLICARYWFLLYETAFGSLSSLLLNYSNSLLPISFDLRFFVVVAKQANWTHLYKYKLLIIQLSEIINYQMPKLEFHPVLLSFSCLLDFFISFSSFFCFSFLAFLAFLRVVRFLSFLYVHSIIF